MIRLVGLAIGVIGWALVWNAVEALWGADVRNLIVGVLLVLVGLLLPGAFAARRSR